MSMPLCRRTEFSRSGWSATINSTSEGICIWKMNSYPILISIVFNQHRSEAHLAICNFSLQLAVVQFPTVVRTGKRIEARMKAVLDLIPVGARAEADRPGAIIMKVLA